MRQEKRLYLAGGSLNPRQNLRLSAVEVFLRVFRVHSRLGLGFLFVSIRGLSFASIRGSDPDIALRGAFAAGAAGVKDAAWLD